MTFSIPIVLGEIYPYQPPVFRYLENKFTNDFFNNGNIRLSSIQKFTQHVDEQRLDKSEGKTLLVHNTEDRGGQALFTTFNHGLNAYIMSASMNLSNALLTCFECDNVFQITNPIGFGASIAKKSPVSKDLS